MLQRPSRRGKAAHRAKSAKRSKRRSKARTVPPARSPANKVWAAIIAADERLQDLQTWVGFIVTGPDPGTLIAFVECAEDETTDDGKWERYRIAKRLAASPAMVEERFDCVNLAVYETPPSWCSALALRPVYEYPEDGPLHCRPDSSVAPIYLDALELRTWTEPLVRLFELHNGKPMPSPAGNATRYRPAVRADDVQHFTIEQMMKRFGKTARHYADQWHAVWD